MSQAPAPAPGAASAPGAAHAPSETRTPGTVRAPHAARSSWIRPFRTWTLRTKLVLAVVALIAVLGAVIGATSVIATQSFLQARLDSELLTALARGSHAANRSFGNGPSDADAIAIVTAPGQPSGIFGAVVTNRKVVLAQVLGTERSQAVPSRVAFLTQPVANVDPDGEPRTANLGPALGTYRLAAVRVNNGDVIVVGLPQSEVSTPVHELLFVVLLSCVGGILIAIGVGTLIIRLSLRPLKRVAATAAEVSQMPLASGDVDLRARVPAEYTDTHTEVGQVGDSLNRLLGHIGSSLAARQASEQKVRQFVADASHELRTPLASIRGYAELTRRSRLELPDDVTHSIGRIESEATRMTSLVEDLLLLARLDEGRALEREPVDLTSMLVDAVSDAHAAGPDHRWALDLPDEPVEVIGDAPRLQQVIVNLLANARVHTPAGTRVNARLSRDPAAATASIAIMDDGPGIPEQFQPELFERFARADSSRARTTGSTGLGLAIVLAVVHAHRGTVEVASEPGSTVFTVTLPVGGAPAADASPAIAAGEITVGEASAGELAAAESGADEARVDAQAGSGTHTVPAASGDPRLPQPTRIP